MNFKETQNLDCDFCKFRVWFFSSARTNGFTTGEIFRLAGTCPTQTNLRSATISCSGLGYLCIVCGVFFPLLLQAFL